MTSLVGHHKLLSISTYKWRKIAPFLVLLAVIVFLQFYFTSIKNSYLVRNTLEVLRNRQLSEVTIIPLHVLVVAYARTGSSFIGDLIQSFPSNFYHFEPLHFISGPVLNSSFDEARELLNNLFNCNISQIDKFIEWQMGHKQFMKLQRNIHYWKDCSKDRNCYAGSYIDNYCLNRTLRVAKTIRLNLLEASKLFTTHPNLNLKIIYLTRDPRGTMNSRAKKYVQGWCKHDVMCYNSSHFCSGLQADVEASCSLSVKKPNDFMVLRYEDVSINPSKAAAQITKFLGINSIPDSVNQFLKTHTYFAGNVKKLSKSMGLEYPYVTVRNSSTAAMTWRREMPFINVTKLQSTCKDFLSAFGYHSYRTVSTLRSNFNFDSDLEKSFGTTCKEYNS